ncbi:MAG: glucose-6-phosphate dehydrogenase [Capsulimonadaceae bacterium]|nr:glucose-6-phosphate dehydrogenase [Capsulimonadaceae bacterium]
MDSHPSAVTLPGLASTAKTSHRTAPPCAFVIFGASGDLTARKLVPALYNLDGQGLLPDGLAVVGVAITEMDDESFRQNMHHATKTSAEVENFQEETWSAFEKRLHYITGGFDQPKTYDDLKARLLQIDNDFQTCGNTLYYLATTPSFFGVIVGMLGELAMAVPRQQGSWTRVIIEKPFGHDLQSAAKLNDEVHSVFLEEQVFRIDHYLGKETVQNILAFRFANSIFEPIWSREHIDHVQITAAETLGVEHRGNYYETAGALRDMFQNHLFQLMALVAMEPPVHIDGPFVRDRKADVLRSIVPLSGDGVGLNTVRAQYEAGEISGEKVDAYTVEPDVHPYSQTETFAAMELSIDNWRWGGVPFYLRSGKRLADKRTEIAITFKSVPQQFFNLGGDETINPNVLVMRIQPNEGILLTLGAKIPGPRMVVRQMQMDFSYRTGFGESRATAYETLLLDAIEGDSTLFNRYDSVELSWKILAPVLEAWSVNDPSTPLAKYPAGSWGPTAANVLIARDGRAWRNE